MRTERAPATTSRRPRRGRRQRAASEALSAVILTTILFGSGVTFVGSIIQFGNDELAAGDSRLRLDQAQEAERFNVSAGLVGGKIGAHVFNFGAQPLQIAYLLVTRDLDGAVVGVNDTALLSTPVTANPGSRSVDVVSNFPFPDQDTYTVTVVTRRGNVGRDIYPPASGPSYLTLPNIGWLVLEYIQFQWAQSSTGNPDTWGAWGAGWQVPGNRYTVFRVNVTNRYNLNITIAQDTLLMMFEGGSTDTIGFWIMNAALAGAGGSAYTETNVTRRLGNVTAYSSPVTVPANSWRWLYFSTASVGSGSPDRFPSTDTSYATAFMFYGTWTDGAAYGQTIPFEAVRRQ